MTESTLQVDGLKPHVLVVDDDERIRTLLSKFLNRNGFSATGARDAAHARRLLAGLEFDLLVVDVMMPGEDGISLTRWARSMVRTPVILLTARADTEDRIIGLEAGADDYVSKPFEPRELLLRIGAVLRRALAEPPRSQPKVLTLGEVRYDDARGELWRGAELIRLTTSEAALMKLFARHPNQPLSRADILGALGNDADSTQERAIDVQVTRLRRKLNDDPRNPRYLQTVRGAGYMLTPD